MSIAQTSPMTLRLTAHRRDHVLVTIWFITSFRQFPYDELILYPLALYFAWAFVRDFPLIFPMIVRSSILFAFPLWWFLSLLWGDHTILILKSGLQLLLTILICYCIATRLSARDVIISLLITAGIFGVWSAIVGLTSGGIAARGVFDSKNALGMAMVILWLTALCIASDPVSTRRTRAIAVAAACLAGWQIYVSNSATAVLLAIGIAVLIFFLGFIPRTGVLRRPGFYIVTLVILGAGLISLAALSATQEFTPITSILNAFGKDATLTGRTALWDYAIVQIRQEPLLGVGTGGFWTPYDGLSDASRIYTENHKAKSASFSFHNSYYEVAVHQGLIGLGILIVTTLWIVSRILLSFGDTDRLSVVFFMCVTGITLARSITEVGLLSPFSLLSMLFIVGALVTLHEENDET